MAHPNKSRHQQNVTIVASFDGDTPDDAPASVHQIDPREFGLVKAAYAVGETLDLLSIGRSSLYAAVKRGELRRVKFGKRTLFYATDLAMFLTRLRRLSEVNADAQRPGHASSASE
jgi:excisionase family DNA binding protein